MDTTDDIYNDVQLDLLRHLSTKELPPPPHTSSPDGIKLSESSPS